MTARRYLRDGRATSAIEFALVGPAFFILLIGVFDFGMLLFLTLSLESATLNAARFGATGAVPLDATRDERIRQIVHDQTLGLLNDRSLNIQTMVYDNFDAAATAEWLFDLDGDGELGSGETFDDVNGNGVWDGDPGIPGAGGADAIVVYRVSAEYRSITPFLNEALGPFVIRSAAPVRNEPW
ncbi:MAG: TadE family protein [Rubrimonas sp.]|uniref:TadE/TadG family type IV pilus assembly protein n=1 Tax=Rubrimonas sp. TaxID=2036015 RepID=UPI002FDE2DA1